MSRDGNVTAREDEILSFDESRELRPDLLAIADMVPEGSKVLDLGCGDGALLEYLVRTKRVMGRGVERSEEGMLACVRRGLSVRQGNLEEGLADYPDSSFDSVILSQTLAFLNDPAMILSEMLRVGSKAVVSFPNWGFWRCRVEMLFGGRVPDAFDIAEHWYEPPRWQAFTVADFGDFCDRFGFRIIEQTYLCKSRRLYNQWYKNLRATTAVFALRSF